jgi:NAD(P)-dependent dehydrogenase (short-subunit alcohol dehydrogenase family)
MDLQNVAAIVTGAASGLGGATAELLAARGAKVALFDLNEEAGTAHADKIGGVFVKVDVADEDAVADAIAVAERAHGVARILVNCAGIGIPGRTINRNGEPYPLAQFRKVIEVNLVGSFNMISKFAARVATVEPVGEERGVIVNTASVAAYEGQIGQAAYSASKGGIVGMTLPIARDLAQLAVRVNTIAPGIFATPILAILPEETIQAIGRQVPFPSRLGRPEEFAEMVHSIIGNAMLNGETIRLDGAIRMQPR